MEKESIAGGRVKNGPVRLHYVDNRKSDTPSHGSMGSLLIYMNRANRLGMKAKRTGKREPKLDEILNNPKLLDEWTQRVVEGWKKVGRGYSESSKVSRAR